MERRAPADAAREAHADLFLSGALRRNGARVRLDFRVQETATGHTLFADQVEGPDPQAILKLADQAFATIVARLVPDEASSIPTLAAGFTTNLEALQAYEDGRARRIAFHPGASSSLERAIELDPQFVLAHYELADLKRFNSDLPGARQSIVRALALAENAPVPRLQKMLAQALQMRLDLRLDEATQILSSAHNEFPQEIEPIFQLAGIRSASANFAEAAVLLERVIRLDPKKAIAHDQLGYQYAFLGDLNRAMAALDRYVALLPAGGEMSFTSRADAYMINDRYQDAMEEFRKINYRPQLAVAAIHAGDYSMVEALLSRRRMNSLPWDDILGDLAVAHGQLDQAVPYYQGTIANAGRRGALLPWFRLLSLARLYLEQSRPEEALALGRRLDTPWTAGLRGTAHLLLHHESEAEKEFDGLRNFVEPILGEHVAQEAVEYHRMQAAFYSGHFDRVIQMWPRLPRSWWSLYALDVGRAYLQAGVFGEAERHLRLACKAQQAFFMNLDMNAQHNLLTWMLARFYLAELLRKTNRHSDALKGYEEFVQHFEGSTAALPQIANAKEVLARFRLSRRGNLLFSDDFAGNALEPGWDERGTGIWELAGGLLKVTRRPGVDERAQRRRVFPFHDAVFEFSFRMEGVSEIGLIYGSTSGHAIVGRVVLTPQYIRVGSEQIERSGEHEAPDDVNAMDSRIVIEPGKWHTLVIEVRGKRIIAQVDSKPGAVAENPLFDIDKNVFVLYANGAGASFDYIRAYEISSKD
jgi:tetratricopeptide (TPR) repeat protein